MSKFVRQQRLKDFQNNWLDKLAWKVDVSYNESQYEYIFEGERFGTISFFPKSDKIHFHQDNRWAGLGLQFIKKNFLNTKD